MIKGYATLENTKAYLQKKNIKKASSSELYELSSICCGTYLGMPNYTVDMDYTSAIKEAVSGGINLIDTAINYRGMRSEVLVGNVMKDLVEQGLIKRSEVVVATKGGFLPADFRTADVGEDYRETLRERVEEYFRTAIVPDINLDSSGVQKVLERRNAVEYEIIDKLFEESRQNLGLETIDIYYLHNPEASKKNLNEAEFYDEIRKTFELLENKVSQGYLSYYGVSTYSGFITEADDQAYLSIERLVEIAKGVSGEDHHFKFVQLPLNKAMRDAEEKLTQTVNGESLSMLDAAEKLGICVMTNISLAQGKAFDKFTPSEMISYLIDNEKICASMIGMKSQSSVERNIRVLKE